MYETESGIADGVRLGSKLFGWRSPSLWCSDAPAVSASNRRTNSAYTALRVPKLQCLLISWDDNYVPGTQACSVDAFRSTPLRWCSTKRLLSSHFSEVAFPVANSGCSGPFRFPARAQRVASPAILASHVALRGGAPDRVVCWDSRRDSYSAWRFSGQRKQWKCPALVAC